jgi:hypothetical protein
MKLLNEMAVIGDDSLDPGPERLAGFRHGVPMDPTSAFILRNRSSIFLWNFALTYDSETPDTK